MLYAIINIYVLENLEDLPSLHNLVKDVKIQYKSGKQNFHENINKVFEPVTDTMKNTSEDLIKTVMLTPKENNKALESLNNKFSQLLNVRGLLGSHLLSSLSKITNPEKTSR